MTENATPSVTNEAPVAATPAVAAPVAPVETPAAQPAPEAAAQPVAEAPKVESTILGAAKPAPEAVVEEKKVEVSDKNNTEAPVAEAKPEIKPADVKPEDKKVEPVVEVKKDEGSQSDEPAPLPTYEFKAPEGLTLDDAKLGEFTKELAEFETLNKADHAKMQEFGQKLVERHAAEVKSTIERLNHSYAEQWEKQKNDWKESFVKDPEIGGNRQQTTVNAAAEFIRTHGGTEAQQEEFRNLMDMTGAGNHPAMIRILAKAMQSMGEGKPVPANKPVQQNASKVAKRYGNSN